MKYRIPSGGGLTLTASSMMATAGSDKPSSEGGKDGTSAADGSNSNGSSTNKRVALSTGGTRRHRSSLGSSRIRQSHSLNR